MNSLSAIAAEHGLEGDDEEWQEMGAHTWQNDEEVHFILHFLLFFARSSVSTLLTVHVLYLV